MACHKGPTVLVISSSRMLGSTDKRDQSPMPRSTREPVRRGARTIAGVQQEGAVRSGDILADEVTHTAGKDNPGPRATWLTGICRLLFQRTVTTEQRYARPRPPCGGPFTIDVTPSVSVPFAGQGSSSH